MARISLIELKSRLKSYGFDVSKIEHWHVGTSRNCFVVWQNDEKFVLKIYSEAKRSSIAHWINLLKEINSKEEVTINPVNDKVLIFGNSVGFMYKFIEGKHYRELRIPRTYYHFGKIVGKFNKLTRNMLRYGKSNKYLIENVRDSKRFAKQIMKKSEYFSEISQIMFKATELFDREYDGYKFRTQLIHGDLHFDNVLYDKKNNKYIIIDTDGLDSGILAREIMTIISYEITNSNNKNKKTIEEFIKGYESEFKLLKKEKKLIPLLMIPRKLGEIMWLVSKRQERKISDKEFKLFMNEGSVKQLKIILKQYHNMKKIFETV